MPTVGSTSAGNSFDNPPFLTGIYLNSTQLVQPKNAERLDTIFYIKINPSFWCVKNVHSYFILANNQRAEKYLLQFVISLQ